MDQVLRRALRALDDAPDLTTDAHAVAAAALDGPVRLAEVLATIPGAAPHAAPVEATSASTTGGVTYLARVSLSGFRGIAGRVDLDLPPTPGLVLVTGRNGSGKSSIAEAAELALSGSSVRAEDTLWREGLLNLHSSGPAEVEIVLRVDGTGDVTIQCVLDGDDLRRAQISARRGDDAYDVAASGWEDAVSRYRPILTYNELAALASAKPKALFDPINNIVGLDGLTAADASLTRSATDHGRVPKDANTKRTALLEALVGSEDPRARDLHAALKGTKPDVTAARAVLAGTAGSAATTRQTLTAWTVLPVPSIQDARDAATALEAAIERDKRASAGTAGQAKRLADLLEIAIEHREHAEDDTCPVCGQSQLGSSWLEEARHRAQEAKEHAAEASAATAALQSARATIRRLITVAPESLTSEPLGDVDPSEALQAWHGLRDLDVASAPDEAGDAMLIAEVAHAVERVAAACNALSTAASGALAAHDEAWEPVAEQAAEALRVMDEAIAAKARVDAISAARAALRVITESLRKERVARFAEEATTIWAGLRQDSNVAFDGISLVGTNTRREVHLDLSVDGTPGPQAVLSQGELAALGLALFLPRSTADDSPFRFVLIDDPVQSMDPSKVDGLARVLHRLAEARQVVVFTHDDRLLQALRRLALPATNYMIDRGERSVVTVRLVTDAVDQHLRDADALAKETVLPADLVALAVVGYCRDALDDTATECARRRLLGSGLSVADTDKALESAGTTRARLALALLGDARKTASPLDKAITALSPGGIEVVNACVEGVHEPEAADIPGLLQKVRLLVEALRTSG